MSFSFFPAIFSIGFAIVFLLVFGTILVVAIRGISQWTKNNSSPRIPVQARVVTKRAHTSGGMGDASASTTYFITFEFVSGDRKEFCVPSRDYGLIAENDYGILTFQGSRFIGFERNT